MSSKYCNWNHSPEESKKFNEYVEKILNSGAVTEEELEYVLDISYQSGMLDEHYDNEDFY